MKHGANFRFNTYNCPFSVKQFLRMVLFIALPNHSFFGHSHIDVNSLWFEEGFHAFQSSFSAVSTLFYTSKRCLRDNPVGGIDRHGASFEFRLDSHCSCDIVGVYRRLLC